jgi:hypothetical protein
MSRDTALTSPRNAVDHAHPEVRDDLNQWGEWVL